MPCALITTPLEPELVERLMANHPEVEFVYPEALLPRPRYAAEHRYPELAQGEEAEWERLLAGADILFDFGPAALRPTLAARPRLSWIQATSAGVGPLVQRLGLAEGERPWVTTASGVHAGPMAEFVILSMLWFRKDLPGLLELQRQHRWERLAMGELSGSHALVVGLGRVGGAIARDARALGVRVVGLGRRPRPAQPGSEVDEYHRVGDLDGWLPWADFLVLSLPETAETVGLLDARRLRLLRPEAVVVNVGRGSAIDEPALIAALAEGRLRGAALDVVAAEPLDPSSPLWDLPNVLITPHSISTVPAENGRIVDIFDENLSRLREGRPLLNLLDKRAGY